MIALTTSQKKQITWVLLFLMPIVGMVIDLVAPSLPAIAKSLSINNQLAKNLISIYLVGYAFGNFFTGFLTDAFGRKHLLRFSILLFILVSLIPVFFPHILTLFLSRFLQGLTIGGISVILRAIFADILSAEELIHLGTLIGTMWGFGPIIGPVIGGYLQYYFDWQAGFVFFAVIASIEFIFVLKIIPETHVKREPLKLNIIKQHLLEVLQHSYFMTITAMMGLGYALIITFNTVGPFFIQDTLHYSSIDYGHIALCLGVIFLCSTFVARYLLKKYKYESLCFFFINLFFSLILIGFVASYFLTSNLWLTIFISALMYFACGSFVPMSMGKGLSLFQHIAGTAGATMYLINILITSLIAFIISFIKVNSNMVLFAIYFMILSLCMFLYWSVIRHYRVKGLS